VGRCRQILGIDQPDVTDDLAVGGESTVYSISIVPLGGFNSNVTLSASGVPAGAMAVFSPNPITGGSGTSTLMITPTGTTMTGTYTIGISATGGASTHGTNLSLTINP
jgi:serine protease AprX